MKLFLIILVWLGAASAFCIALAQSGHWIAASIIFLVALSCVKVEA